MNHNIDSSQKSDVYDYNLWKRGVSSYVKGHVMQMFGIWASV